MQEEDRRMLKAVHDWLFDPATFTDPLGRPEWAGVTRAQWIEGFAGSMDSVHHTHKSAIDHPDSAFHAIAKAVGATA